jgi:hypothetical protein
MWITRHAAPKTPSHRKIEGVRYLNRTYRLLPTFSANVLDKNRNVSYIFLLAESRSGSPTGGREDEKPWLFETSTHNLPREPGGGAVFLIFSPATH